MFYDTHKQTFHQIFPEAYATQDVRSLYEDKEGIIWVGTSNGVFQIERDSKKIRQHTHLPDNLVRTVIKDQKDKYGQEALEAEYFCIPQTGSC